jgi:hypothetical protein
MKLQTYTKTQAGICTVLYAVAPETRMKHSCKCFGGVAEAAAWASVRFLNGFENF